MVRSGSILAVSAHTVLTIGVWWSGVTVVIVRLSKGEGHGHPDDDLATGEEETGGTYTSTCQGLHATARASLSSPHVELVAKGNDIIITHFPSAHFWSDVCRK